MLNVKCSPPFPSICLRHPFHISIITSGGKIKVNWLSLQIIGKISPKNSKTVSSLHAIVNESLGADHKAPFFGHVMSGSRLIESSFEPPLTFDLLITIDNCPPSYNGKSSKLEYELRVSFQIGSVITNRSFIFSLFSSSLNEEFNIKDCQSSATFVIEKGSSSLPFRFQNLISQNTVQCDIALLKFPYAVVAGGDIEIEISFLMQVESVDLFLLRKECYKKIFLLETMKESEASYQTSNILMTHVSLPTQSRSVQSFRSDFIDISYSVQIKFHTKSSSTMIEKDVVMIQI